ncbi:antiviral reverse transcriptase Drt2 [Hymenobacter cheonanensis]|uniref:antiviral reverse transcriptase Drt2 n=1 Tax=Hymenobacter sp. CA2-7 TaxID=3063993 RepID=UPI0027131068|nr:antiviral reverse transcriptase Drt2 [Hymenobacter sp. CA2-7]MDO7884275.1 antiviral reverse transcriptase Drt2 [Hymenobacter sp. CA2-7]
MADETLFARWGKQMRRRQQTQAVYAPKGGGDVTLAGKSYLHFDFAVSDAELAEWKPKLLDPEQVRQRSFYPFLKMVKLRKRFKKGEDGVRRPASPKPRDICYAAHHDALFYSWYGFQLEQLLELRLQAMGVEECVLAYRATGRNNLHFAKEVFDYIADQSSCVALAFDVTKFFDTLDHGHLKRSWVDLLAERELPRDHYTIFKAMTRFRFVLVEQLQEALGAEGFARCKRRRRLVYPHQFRAQLLPLQQTNLEKRGIPQGAPLSAVLSNLYMLPVDIVLHQFAEANQGIYRRYCDDLLLVLPIGTEHAAEALVRAQLSGLCLELNEGKTERRFFTRTEAGELECRDEKCAFLPLQYLGLEYCGRQVLLRGSSLAKYHQRLRSGVRKAVWKAKKAGGEKTYRRKLYTRFTRLGESNFITYAERAYQVTGSEALRRQVSGSVERVQRVLRQEEGRYRGRGGVIGGVGHRRVGF